MKKALFAILAVSLIFNAYHVFPVYANTTSITVETVETIFVDTIEIQVKRHDIYQYNLRFVQFEADFMFNGARVLIKSDPMPLSKFQSLRESSMLSTDLDPMPKYEWDGLLFAAAPGNSTHWVKYDHPDNYDTYYQYIDGNPQNNIDYMLNGTSRHHHHIAHGRINEAISKVDLAAIFSGTSGPIVLAILAALGIVTGGLGLLVAGAIIAAVALVWRCVVWFLQNIVQTELGDGWVWTWGYGKWDFLGRTRAFWWRMSFGALRDWGFLIFVWNFFGGGGGSGGRNFLR